MKLSFVIMTVYQKEFVINQLDFVNVNKDTLVQIVVLKKLLLGS